MLSPLSIFVYEHLTGGACAGVPPESSLMTEGRAMADAVIADFAALDDVQVVTLRDRRLPAVEYPGVTTYSVDDPDGELSEFQRVCASSERVFVIAPETDGILAERIEQARRVNSDGVCNCSGDGLRLGSDKWELFQQLQEWNISTIPTALWSGDLGAYELPLVVKPRDGAGCEGLCVIRDDAGTSLHSIPSDAGVSHRFIVQPLLEGIALSSAACFSPTGQRLLTLPVGRQLIEIDGAIRYSGGEVPWQDEMRQLAEQQAETVWQILEQNLSGLAGYIGIDWLWDETTETLRVVELNPRLTTAYVGYRELGGTQIVEVLLGREVPPEATSRESIRFSADGVVDSGVSEKAVS